MSESKQRSHILALSDEDLAVIAAALNELPRKHSEPVLQRLQRQLDAEKKVEEPDVVAAVSSKARRG